MHWKGGWDRCMSPFEWLLRCICSISLQQSKANMERCSWRNRAAKLQLTRCAVKDCRRLFQKASTKILLYLMALGQTVQSRSKAPRLNMTQYSLLTQVPSGKMSNGVVLGAATWAFILSPTILRSLTCMTKCVNTTDADTIMPSSTSVSLLDAFLFAGFMFVEACQYKGESISFCISIERKKRICQAFRDHWHAWVPCKTDGVNLEY